MKIIFERNDIVCIGNNYIPPRAPRGMQIKLRHSQKYSDLAEALNGLVLNVEFKYSGDSVISGSFIWLHSDSGYTYLESTGVVNYSNVGREGNDKVLRRIAKIQNQLDKLKIDLDEDKL
jgi:hypothetical protein